LAISVGRPRGGAIADINVTPMADVMIVLLIIFMVATPIIAGAPVTLPDASHLTEHAGERLEIVLRREGGLEIDGTALASADLLAEYLGVRTASPESLLLLVQADRDVSYSAVARVLAACRRAGVGQVALAAALKPGRLQP
jgi:biopolymer transport protein ExbD